MYFPNRPGRALRHLKISVSKNHLVGKCFQHLDICTSICIVIGCCSSPHDLFSYISFPDQKLVLQNFLRDGLFPGPVRNVENQWLSLISQVSNTGLRYSQIFKESCSVS